MADRLEHIRRAVPGLDIGAMNQRANQQAKGIGDDMALAPPGLLACVIAPNTAAFRGYHALAIYHAGRQMINTQNPFSRLDTLEICIIHQDSPFVPRFRHRIIFFTDTAPS